MVSVRRVAPVLLIAAAMPVFAAKTPKSSSHPPRQLHKVGDHWTAYNPPDPATYSAGAKTVAVKQGDTLWGIAQTLFKNAYLWPQLWESNTWITDAHWIYPGDLLLVEGELAQQATANETSTTTSTSTTDTGTGGSPILGSAPQPLTPTLDVSTGMSTTYQPLPFGTTPVLSSTPVPLGGENEVYCYGYLGDPNESMPNHISSYEDYEMRYEKGAVELDVGGSTGDLVFIAGGTSTGITAGETYLILEPGDLVYHPRTRALIGRHWDFRGQLRVLCAEEKTARAVITQSCFDVHVGARLKPLPQIPIPLARIPAVPGFCDPTSGKTGAFIVSAQGGWNEALGNGVLIEINMGKDDELQPGDFLTVWREGPLAQPRQVLGEIGVLTTEAHTATAIVVGMRYSMQIGDHVERQ